MGTGFLRWALPIVALTFGVPAAPAPVTVRDGRGRVVRLAAPPKRIVSLNPSVTEILFAVGAGPRVVGVSDYCDYPPEASKRAHIGGYQPSIEKVVALRPDVVIAGAEANRRVIPRMEQVGRGRFGVFAIEPRTLAELYRAITDVGRVTGCEGRARSVAASLRARMAAVARSLAGERDRPGVVFVIERQPLWVAGSHCFLDDMIRSAGGTNVTADAGAGYHPYSLERLVARRPWAIVTAGGDRASFDASAGWSRLDAVRARRVIRMGYEAVRWGPRLVDVVERLARSLHPAAFREAAAARPRNSAVTRIAARGARCVSAQRTLCDVCFLTDQHRSG